MYRSVMFPSRLRCTECRRPRCDSTLSKLANSLLELTEPVWRFNPILMGDTKVLKRALLRWGRRQGGALRVHDRFGGLSIKNLRHKRFVHCGSDGPKRSD